MNKRILISLSVIGAVAAIAIGGTIAYFSDTETSSGNTFTAGTLDLEVGSPSDLPILLTNMAPGVESGDLNITWQNIGSLPGTVSWQITTIADGDGVGTTEFPAGQVSAADFAKKVYVTKAYFDRNGNDTYEPCGADNVCGNPGTDGIWGTADDVKSDDDEDVLGHWIQWTEVDPVAGATLDDGKASLFEMQGKGAGLRTWTIDDSKSTPKLDAGDSYKHQLKFTLDENVGNEFQAEGINVTVTVTLNQ